jgi:hypothetical protein
MTPRYAGVLVAAVAMLALGGGAVAPALAQGDFETPTITYGPAGLAKQTITVTAGATGAPAGFTVWWMKKSDFIANGSQWWLYGDPMQGEASFTGAPTLNTGDGAYTTFALGPNQSVEIEIGDLADESGVALTGWRSDYGGELEYGTDYVFCAFANASTTVYQSGFSENMDGATIQSQNCTFTQGYWKNHTTVWPVSSLTLGANTYTQAQLLQILGQPVQGNGSISLAHQLIATLVNIANGASPTAVQSCVNTAQSMLSACGANKIPPIGTCNLTTSSTSSTTQCLDNWNNGITGPGHCGTVSARKSSWGELKLLHR